MKIGIRLGAQTAHNAGELRKKKVFIKCKPVFFSTVLETLVRRNEENVVFLMEF